LTAKNQFGKTTLNSTITCINRWKYASYS